MGTKNRAISKNVGEEKSHQQKNERREEKGYKKGCQQNHDTRETGYEKESRQQKCKMRERVLKTEQYSMVLKCGECEEG